jgi:protein-S-isoprenylcysteine O-methyltransferase Ste14
MLGFAIAMWLTDRYLPVAEWIGGDWQRAGYVVMTAALVIDLWALLLFHRSRTTIHPLRLGENRALVVAGVYRLTRNPMYLGLLLLLTGFAVRLGSVTPFLLLPVFVTVMYRFQIVHEERFLADKYGSAYDEYRARVGRWV